MERTLLKFESKPLEQGKRDVLNAFRLLFCNTIINYYGDVKFSIIDIIEHMIKAGYTDEHNAISVTDLYVLFRCDQSVMSQQLAKLRTLRLVDYKKEGKIHMFWAHKDRLDELKAIFKNITST